ncbi:MarR family winged helix-turn-helix transcriptional regulator [Methylobacterium oryzisoli]|uniref:MarR family winged helix-turn-helix transcriptional regulator n=1 Tax=Methylobacterium oryzisoli TaxID=3385502 RepID=UPI0038918D68
MKPKSSAGSAPSDVTLTLASFLPYRLNVAAAAVSEGLARLYATRFGIGIPEWRVLATVGEFRSMTATATAIGLHAHMGKVKVSRAAAALEARELIRREPNPEDLREAFLVLTPAGEAVYAEIVPLALDYARRLTAEFRPDEEAMLNRLIDRLLRRASEMGGA